MFIERLSKCFIVKRDKFFLFEVLSAMFHLSPSSTSIKLNNNKRLKVYHGAFYFLDMKLNSISRI